MSTQTTKRLKWTLLLAIPLLLVAAMIPALRARRERAATQKLVFECRDLNLVRVDVIQTLIDQGADVNGRCLKDCPPDLVQNNSTPLQLCVESGSAIENRDGSLRKFDTRPAMKLLLRHGAKINAPSSSGTTALILATVNGSPEMVRFLIDNGADVNSRAEPLALAGPTKKVSSALGHVNYRLSPAFQARYPNSYTAGSMEKIKKMLIVAGAQE